MRKPEPAITLSSYNFNQIREIYCSLDTLSRLPNHEVAYILKPIADRFGDVIEQIDEKQEKYE